MREKKIGLISLNYSKLRCYMLIKKVCQRSSYENILNNYAAGGEGTLKKKLGQTCAAVGAVGAVVRARRAEQDKPSRHCIIQ